MGQCVSATSRLQPVPTVQADSYTHIHPLHRELCNILSINSFDAALSSLAKVLPRGDLCTRAGDCACSQWIHQPGNKNSSPGDPLPANILDPTSILSLFHTTWKVLDGGGKRGLARFPHS